MSVAALLLAPEDELLETPTPQDDLRYLSSALAVFAHLVWLPACDGDEHFDSAALVRPLVLPHGS